MALGVLNNLSAIYAENNLNNTNSSLQTVLQQLSSGSRINSGADDAAGLSLVNGLKANSTALIQSATNATEGVGLLQVADGALSQVTSLLNRAITLATEASNGTLNSSQDGAANQEYQSILAEINNIGSTTTYNQQTVFGGGTISIFTGDSSTKGSSLDKLNIRSLSSASVGGTSGVMSYTNGQNNAFINLSKQNGNGNAQAGDTLSGGGNTTSTVTVEYVVNGANGMTVQSQAISVGGANGYPNTGQGLMDAINNSGLGLTATWGTASQAGSQAVGSALSAGAANATVAGAETGIIISGNKIAAGASPSGMSTSGVLAANSAGTSGFASANDTFTGTLTVNGVLITAGNAASGTIAGVAGTSATNTLSALVTAINTTGAAVFGGATASVVENADGTFGLAITQKPDTNGLAPVGALTVTGTLTDTAGGSSTVGDTMNFVAGSPYSFGIAATTVQDSVQTASAVAVTDTNGSGIATMSYTDSAGQSLSGTDLTTAANAQTALTYLNQAITDVAAQDGYIGAQINTLNSISQVMNTQQENVVSAQNAIQATDYAAATSNMSKYEILSQTGIAALAQANSVEQEVTKLLQ